MKKVLVLHGPNINLTGIREPGTYGKQTLEQINKSIGQLAQQLGVACDIFQSNHEGILVDKIQAAYGVFDGIIINPAAYTHTSIAILDALKAVAIPAVEVHLSDVSRREGFRQISYAGMACVKTYMGLGFDGYREAIFFLKEYLQKNAQARP